MRTGLLFFQKIYGTAAQQSCCQWFPKKEKIISTKQNVFFGQYWKNQYLKNRHNSSKERVKKKSAKVSLGTGQSSFEKSHCYASNRICLKLVLKSLQVENVSLHRGPCSCSGKEWQSCARLCNKKIPLPVKARPRQNKQGHQQIVQMVISFKHVCMYYI